MRIIINVDPIKENGKRLRIRTRYQLGTKDGKMHIQARNALVEFYNDLVQMIEEGADKEITDFVNEGERV